MVRLLLAEDQGMMRGALARLLNLEADMEVVAEVSRGDEVIPTAEQVLPDLALLDIEMPGLSGLDVAVELRQRMPSCRVVILTTFGRPGYLRRAVESGAAGFLIKDAPVANLAVAIRRIMNGERVIDPDLAAAALSEGANPLSVREQDVLRAAYGGADVADIANRLHISEGTVRNHLSAVIQKLYVRNREQAIHVAREKGWI